MCSKPNTTDQNKLSILPLWTTLFKAQVGTECDSFILESLEKEVESRPEEPTAVVKTDGTMTKIEEMKFKSKYDKYLNRIHKVKMQPEQTYSKYYEQMTKKGREHSPKTQNLTGYTKRKTC